MKAGYLLGSNGEIFAEVVMFSDGSTATKFDGGERTIVHTTKQAELYFNLVGHVGSKVDWRVGCSPRK